MSADRTPIVPGFLAGGSIMASEILAHDWATEAPEMGAISTWPCDLKATLALLLDSPQGMFIGWGPELRLFYNDAYRPLLGTRARRSLGLPFSQVWEQEWEALGGMVRRCLGGQAVNAEDFPLPTTRNGVREVAYFSFASSPLRDEQGEVCGLFCIVRETTVQLAAKHEWQASYHALRDEVSARRAERDRNWSLSTDLLGIGRFDGYMRDVNPAWVKVLGYRRDAILSQPFASVVHPDDLAAMEAGIERMRQGEKLHHLEMRLLTQSKRYRWIAWTGVPAGDLFYVNGRDITDQKAAVDELAVAQQALRQSHKMEAVGQLTGGIAHDFNNLLQGIVGSLDLIQRRMQQGQYDQLPRYVSGAMESANRASALTHRLLAFSRRQPLDPRPLDVNRLVQSMDDLLRRTLTERFDISLRLCQGLWSAMCDANQLESAILNLVINARDAMPHGGQVVIETGVLTCHSPMPEGMHDITPGDYVTVSVIDTGIGMSDDVAARAFDPFFTTKPLGQGTGLGLSMIYGFARQSEGYVKIRSQCGVGTAVTLYLPRCVHDQPPVERVPESVDESHAGDGEVVVVVEDETVVRALIVEVLSDRGYQVLEAKDGLSGLALLDRVERVDLLITDIGLPGLNGRKMVEAARMKRPALKVLFMTGYAETAAAAQGFLDADMRMMTKPFSIDTLGRALRVMLPSE